MHLWGHTFEIGGKEILMEKCNGQNALHTACLLKAAAEVIVTIAEIGGCQLVLEKNSNGSTALHYAIWRMVSIEVIKKLIEIGGRELVMVKSVDGSTSLHLACRCPLTPTETIMHLIEVGGQELVMEKDNHGSKNKDGNTPLHIACSHGASIEVIMKLVEIGGHELVKEKNTHRELAWQCGYSRFTDETRFIYMIKEGLLAELGGEFGIAGLFSCNDEENDTSPSQNNSTCGIQEKIYSKWENYIAPSLETVVVSLEHKKLPILHAAIMAKAPQHVINDTINRFDCILSKDSFGRYPVHVAVEIDLGENNERMKQVMNIILEATAAAQQRPVIHVAAEYGLKWNRCVKELVESNIEEVVDGCDGLTGLRLFMLAAMGSKEGGCCYLNSIYGLMRMSPEI